MEVNADNSFDQQYDDENHENYENDENYVEDENDDGDIVGDMVYDVNGFYSLSTRDDIHIYHSKSNNIHDNYINERHLNNNFKQHYTTTTTTTNNNNNNNQVSRERSYIPKDLLTVFVHSTYGCTGSEIARNYIYHHLVNNYHNKNNVDHQQNSHHLFQAIRFNMPIVNEKYWNNNEYFKTSHYITVFMKRVTVYILTNRFLELLTYQAIIRCHLHTQDNLFTIRVIQILLYHYINYDVIMKKWLKCKLDEKKQRNKHKHWRDKSYNDHKNKKINYRNHLYDKSVVRNCLLYLIKSNINIVRAIRIGAYLSAKSVDSMIPPTIYYELHPMLSTLDGASSQHNYLPV